MEIIRGMFDCVDNGAYPDQSGSKSRIINDVVNYFEPPNCE